MANPEHEAILRQGVEVWNQWRKNNPDIQPDLSEAVLRDLSLNGANLCEVNFYKADLSKASLRQATFRKSNLSKTNFSGANLREVNFYKADLSEATLDQSDLRRVDFGEANLSQANLNKANLAGTYLKGSNLAGANLNGANLTRTNLVEANLENADISGSRIFGISAWGLNVNNLKQSNLIITKEGEPEITVDDLEIAQFIYLLLNNAKFRNVIDTITTKSVLILGRFTDERKKVLDSIRAALRDKGYVPILFDFDKPNNRNFSETVMTIASLSSFVIIDLSDPNSISYEALLVAERLRSVPLQGIFCPTAGHPDPFPMYEDLRSMSHVLPIYHFNTPEQLMVSLDQMVIQPAEDKVKALRPTGGTI